VDCIHLAQCRDQLEDVVNLALNIQVAHNAVNSFSSSATAVFSRTQLHGLTRKYLLRFVRQKRFQYDVILRSPKRNFPYIIEYIQSDSKLLSGSPWPMILKSKTTK
jgi:hypothetical protein